MEEWFIAWLDRFPPWLQVALVCAFFIAATWLGIVAVHPVLRRLLHGDEPSNEAIIFSAANFGLFYACFWVCSPSRLFKAPRIFLTP
jgi:hypothetical protein